jgi:hypothetical protein
VIRRPTLRGISLVATSSLLALMLIGPASTLAATPNLTQYGIPAPATVSANATGAIILGIHNGDSSTVSQLFLTGASITGDGTFTLANPSQGTCTGTSCTLGQLKPGHDITVALVYTAGSVVGTVTGSGTFNTTGTAGTGDNSHGDSWFASAQASVSTDTLNFGGRYINNGNLVVQDNQSVNKDTNRQATKVVAPGNLIGVSVSDGGTQGTCPATLTCFGETSAIEVAAGASFPGGFQVIITLDSSEIPGGVTTRNVRVYHTWVDAPTPGSETISARCSFTNGLPNSMPCLNAVKVNGNDIEITIWTTHNGFMKPAG